MYAKKTYIIIIAVLFCFFNSQIGLGQAQRAKHWAFPLRNGLIFNYGSIVNDTSVVPAPGVLTQSTSTMSDTNGELLFYSNGEKCWNKNHQVMPNGAGLLGNQETSQSSIIIPAPGLPDRYFLFTLDLLSGGNGLNYYIVDMNFGGGLGDIVSPATQLDDTLTYKLCATKHANDLFSWVVTHDWGTNEFHAYQVDTFGVNTTPVVSSVGLTHVGFDNAAMGQMKISPDGTRIALASWLLGFVQLFDFNPQSGAVSNPITLQSGSQNFPFGIEFSPDSRKLFISQRNTSGTGYLYQFDIDHLDEDCLLESENVVGFPANELKIPSSLQLGIDGRIYMTVLFTGSYDTLAIIENPNVYGLGCGFEEFGWEVNGRICEGLTSVVSTYLSGGIHVEFGTTCDQMSTVFFPEDSLDIDSVSWNFGDPASGSLNSSSQIQSSHIFTSPDTFTVTLLTFRNNNVDTFIRNVIIWDTAVNLLGNDTTICSGSPIQLSAEWNNSCLAWSTGASTSAITVSTEGWYWVDVYYQSCYFRDSIYVHATNGPPVFELGNDTSVCNNSSFILDPNLPYVYYTWQDGSHDTAYIVTGTGTYSLTATNACGSTSDSLQVTLNFAAQPVLSFPDDTAGCDTIDFILDVTFTDAVYLWSDGSTNPVKQIAEPGIYWVRVRNVCDSVSDTFSITFDTPVASALKDQDILCGSGDTIELLGTGDSTTVLWNSVLPNPTFLALNPGFYWFSSENGCGYFEDTIQIIIWDTSYKIDLGRDTTVCPGSPPIFYGDSNTEYLLEYSWSNGITNSFNLLDPGIYTVTASNRCTSLSDEIKISTPDLIEIAEPKSRILCEGDQIVLAITDLLASHVAWSTGDTSNSILVNEPGIYSMNANDTLGCHYHDSIALVDDCPIQVFTPNVFTPNGDLINDMFCAETKNVSEAFLYIYNRWGTLIYSSTDIPTCWDGDIAGSNAIAGTYYYLVSAKDPYGETRSFRGSFTLIR